MFFHNVTYVIYEDIILMPGFQLCKESEKNKEQHLYFFPYALTDNRLSSRNVIIQGLKISTVPVPTQKDTSKKLLKMSKFKSIMLIPYNVKWSV